MSPIMVVGVLAALAAGGATHLLMRPALGTRLPWEPLAFAAVTAIITVLIGSTLDAAPLAFLVGMSAFVFPVLVLLEVAAVVAGAHGFTRRLVLGVWGFVVFPVAVLVPLLTTHGCLAPDCGFDDFGGALPLVVSSAAFVALAWRAAGARKRAAIEGPAVNRVIVAIALLWVASSIWLAHLEGVIDEYTPLIVIAAITTPIASAIGWLAVDRIRSARRPVGRSLLWGFGVGLVVAWPGAVSVGMPWSAITGFVAGALAALVFSLTERDAMGPSPRWGLTVLTAVAVGFLAPAVSGDGSGLLFSARAAVLVTPLIALVGVVAFSVAVSIPVWLVVRRRAGE